MLVVVEETGVKDPIVEDVKEDIYNVEKMVTQEIFVETFLG